MATEKTMRREELFSQIDNLKKKNRRLSRLVARQRDEFVALTTLVRRVADNAPDMIWAKDLDNRYLFANRALCEYLLMCGSPEEALGKTDLHFAERERAGGHEADLGTRGTVVLGYGAG